MKKMIFLILSLEQVHTLVQTVMPNGISISVLYLADLLKDPFFFKDVVDSLSTTSRFIDRQGYSKHVRFICTLWVRISTSAPNFNRYTPHLQRPQLCRLSL